MNTIPLVVTMGPPRLGEPHSGRTCAATSALNGAVNDPSGFPPARAGPQVDRDQRSKRGWLPTDIGQDHQRASHAWRRKDSLVTQRFYHRSAGGTIFFRESPYIVGGEAMRAEWWRHRGERLRGRCLLAWYVARRHRALFDRKDRPAGAPFENEQHPGLGGLQDGRYADAVARDVHERRRRRVVVGVLVRAEVAQTGAHLY